MFVVAASGGADDVGVCKQIVAAKLLEPLARPDQQPHEGAQEAAQGLGQAVRQRQVGAVGNNWHPEGWVLGLPSY